MRRMALQSHFTSKLHLVAHPVGRAGVRRFHKETFGRLGIARRTQEKLQGTPFRIDRPVEIHPHFLEFDVGLIYFPGIVASFVLHYRDSWWSCILFRSILCI